MSKKEEIKRRKSYERPKAESRRVLSTALFSGGVDFGKFRRPSK